DLTRTVTVHTSTGVWHGPSLVHRALAVVVFFGAPAVVGLVIGDAFGRRRARPAVRSRRQMSRSRGCARMSCYGPHAPEQPGSFRLLPKWLAGLASCVYSV